MELIREIRGWPILAGIRGQAGIDEAKLVIQLNNPNICKVFDWGKVEDSYYLAMEYVSGCTLRQAYQRCKEQQVDGVATMPLAQACLIAMKLCEGLDYAQQKMDFEDCLAGYFTQDGGRKVIDMDGRSSHQSVQDRMAAMKSNAVIVTGV